MTTSEEQLRGQLTHAMAQAIDEEDSYKAYFGEATEAMDYGVARADGSLPADMFFLWDFAGYIAEYVAAHGIDALEVVEQVGNLFVAYQAMKAPKNDFDDSEKDKLQQAVASALKELVEAKK